MKRTSIVLKIAVLLCFVFVANVQAQTFEEEMPKWWNGWKPKVLKERFCSIKLSLWIISWNRSEHGRR